MQGARYQLLARSSLAQDADTRFASGYTFYLRHDALHGFALPHDLVFAETALQVAILTLQAAEFERVLDSEQKFVGRNRLFQEIERAQTRGANSHLDVGLAGHHYNWTRHALRFQFFK